MSASQKETDMTVRAKFRVDGHTEDTEGLVTVLAHAVYDPNPESENGKFWKYTPAGEFKISCVNPGTLTDFPVGAEFYIDMIPASIPGTRTAIE